MTKLLMAAILSVGMIASPANAATAVYTITGTGEATIGSFMRIFLPDGSVSDTGSNTLAGTGGFTASYSIDLASLPANTAGPGYISNYQSYSTANFLKSMTTATFGTEAFGLTTNGGNYTLISDGIDFVNADIIVTTGLLHGTEVNEYFASGALKSRTTFDRYNQFFANWGGSNIVGGISLPGLASGSQQIIFSESKFSYNEDGSFASFSTASRTFLGNGTATFSVVSGAVPESSTWLMLVAGFGLIGGAMRRQRKTSGAIAGAAAAQRKFC